ncbi:serine-rich adhesin for platelets-like [Hetaerina americana]|uniref:serine-rich adhesin for platelets-like n=1 Tax=Hetaerina americana TaxID=62018 RepID=UPI003A7F14F2
MGGKNSESGKYREWERERRERLNVSFNDLGSLLPNHDPAISTSKVDILQKSAAYIRDLKKENSDLLLSGANKLQTKKIKRLQRYVEVLLLRVQQLAKLLRDAGITLPPEPPTIAPLGKKTPRWSNKISPKDAEKALEAEKNSNNTSQKKTKVTKKDLNSPSKKDIHLHKSPAKSDNPSSLLKSPTAGSKSSGNKLRSSPQKVDKDSAKIPVPGGDRSHQENGNALPVGQLFSDPSRILTSLPPHVVGPEQQPGIIVIRATGASTLGAVTQHPSQSTCFVIDNGNCGSVNNGQPSAIVASHPPTLEPRPTFVLASNGSLLPVLPSQFVAQPRQLIVSTSSPVSATNQALAPIAFSSSTSKSQCIKPLREVKCSQPISGDISQMKKIPIPALPRNKQKTHSNIKEGTDAAGKTIGKKKCASLISETAKTSKGAHVKHVEKKNIKLPSSNASQEKSSNSAPPSKDASSVSNDNSSTLQEESLPEKHENIVLVTSNPTSDSGGDSRKRELPESCSDDGVLAKRRKAEDTDRSESGPCARSEELSNSASTDALNDRGPVCNSEIIINTTCPLNVNTSSYSIDALCKMNEKISVINAVGSIQDVTCPKKEKFVPNEINSQKDSKDQVVENNCLPGNHISVTPASSENSLKSVQNSDVVGVHPEERDKVSSNGNKSTELLIKDGAEHYMPDYSSSEHTSQQDTVSSLVDSQNIISRCSLETISHNDEEASARNAKSITLSGSEHKGKVDSQSSILPTFGSSSNFPNSEDPYRKEDVGRESNCETNQMDESSLPPGAFSSDLFASLQVPSGHSESISPTAAFLLAFPLVSTLNGKAPDLGSDNHHSQPMASLENGNGDNDLTTGGCSSSFLQLGNLEDNSPSSSSQSILSSLTSSNPSSQSTILQLKSASTIHSLVPRSVENEYSRESIETDIHLVERQVTPSKDLPLKVVSKVTPYIPPISSSESSEDRPVIEGSSHKESNPSSVKIDSMSLKSHSSKENERDCIDTHNGSIPSQESNSMNSMSNSCQTQKPPHQDNQVASISTQSSGQAITSTANKSDSNTCQNQSFQVDSRSGNCKKDGSDNRMFSSSNQQYVSYQLPHVPCGSTDLPEPLSASSNITQSTEESTSNRVLRQDIQTVDRSISNSNLPHNQSNLTFQHIDHSYKSETRPINGSKEIQSHENNYSNSYVPQNPSASIPTPVSSTNCFSISSFTTSFPSTISNSLLSSCIVTNSSPSFSSANTAPLLMTSSSYSTSSSTYPSHSNALYSSSSSTCVTPIYSSSFTPALCSSSGSFPNSSFSSMPACVSSTTMSSRATGSSKTSVSSSVAMSAARPDTYPNHQGNVLPNLLPAPAFSNSVSTTLYDNSQKENNQPVSSAQHQNNHPLKDSGVEHKGHTHGNSSNMHSHMSEPSKSHNIFSVEQLNNQNYCYNFNDYTSHMTSYMPQKPELEMIAKKSSTMSSETHGGNLTSRMPGSFSVAHNSSNFSILSWTTLSPMSAAPSSSLDPQMNSMNGKVDNYSSSPSSLGLSSGENGPPMPGKVSDASAPSFPQTFMSESRDVPNSYPQYPVGNNNMGTETNGLVNFPMQQDVSKQSSSRGQGLKPRQQVTNWMTAPDPIHSTSDFAHNSDVSSDHVRDAFGSSAAVYNSNTGFYTHHNQSEMPYVTPSNSSVGSGNILDRRNVVQSIATGTNGNSQKSCPNVSGPSRTLGENILPLQPKPSDSQENQLTSSSYNKMTNSSNSYIHSSQSELPALPTLVGDLALGSCNSMKGYLPIYDEANSITSKTGKQDIGKVQSSHANIAGCGSTIPAKENRDGRSNSSTHEYGVSSFLSVSQLVDHVKDSNHQSQPRENDRSSGEKGKSRDANKTAPPSRRNIRQSNVKRDAVITSKEQQESSQMYHSRIPSHSSQAFTNQGISPSIVSSNPTHLHAPPIPFPPYNSVHWPVNEMTKVADNSRSTANYKSSSSYSAEALIRPSLSSVALDSRLPDVEMSAYGMDIHKYSIPGGRGDHLFTDFAESNAIGSNMENIPLPQNHLKQNAQDHRETNDNFRSGHHSSCDKFNYSTSSAPTTFHTHHHHSHLPPSFGNSDDYSVESGNHNSSLGLSSNCMDFAPFTHSKESGPITSSMSNVCASIGYSSPANASVGINQNQSHLCRSQEGKLSMRSSGGNCDKACSSSATLQVGPSKTDCSVDGGTKQPTKDNGVGNNTRSVPTFLPMEPSASSYIGHHYPPHNHRHHNPTSTHYPSGHTMETSSITQLNDSEHQAPKLFPRFPAPSSGVNHLSNQSSSVGSGVGSSSHLSSGTLTNFNLSTIFPEINDKQTHHTHITPSTSSFESASKSSKLSTVTSTAPILHPPSPLSTSYHHYRPHQHNHQPFPSSVDLGSRLPPPHPPSGVLHSNVSFNNLMVQSTPQVNGIGINSPLQPPPPPFSAPSFSNVLPGL